jgi:RNA polymerase sigma-70 factor (ECF subfamily)
VNLARNRLRWWMRRPLVSLDEWTKLPPQESDEPAGAGKLEQSERAEAVRRAIAALPADYREAVILFEYERLSYADISSALGISQKTVENRILRGREKLKSTLRSWL